MVKVFWKENNWSPSLAPSRKQFCFHFGLNRVMESRQEKAPKKSIWLFLKKTKGSSKRRKGTPSKIRLANQRKPIIQKGKEFPSKAEQEAKGSTRISSKCQRKKCLRTPINQMGNIYNSWALWSWLSHLTSPSLSSSNRQDNKRTCLSRLSRVWSCLCLCLVGNMKYMSAVFQFQKQNKSSVNCSTVSPNLCKLSPSKVPKDTHLPSEMWPFYISSEGACSIKCLGKKMDNEQTARSRSEEIREGTLGLGNNFDSSCLTLSNSCPKVSRKRKRDPNGDPI